MLVCPLLLLLRSLLLLLLGLTAARAVVAIVSASLCAVVRSPALTPLGGGTRVCAS